MNKDRHKHVENIACTTESWQTIGYRSSQEDRFISAHAGHGTIAAVMDGHGGPEAADMVVEFLVADFAHEFRRMSRAVGRNWFTINEERMMVRRTVAKLVKRGRMLSAGTTLSLVYTHSIIRDDEEKPVLRTHIATLGDSPASILRGGRTTVMTVHSARHNMKDINRINDTIINIAKIRYDGSRNLTSRELPMLCAKVFRGYVYINRGSLDSVGLAMTRAIGDAEYGDLLIRKADIRTYDLPTDAIILLATDGIEDDGLPDPVKDQCEWILSRLIDGDTLAAIGSRISPCYDNTTMLTLRFSEVATRWR